MIPESLKNINTLNIEDDNNILNINDIYVGPECECLLATLSLEHAREIRLNIYNFKIFTILQNGSSRNVETITV